MRLVGNLRPWEGEFTAVVVDADRHVAYMGTFDTRGVAVMDIRDRSNPVLTDELLAPQLPNNPTDCIDVDLVGRYLLVSHHPIFGRDAFAGVSVYDTSADPYHPVLLRRIRFSACGLENSILDPEVESGRPYAYCSAFCLSDPRVFVVNILTGEIVGSYVSPEPFGCPPFPCAEVNAPHETMVRRHPRSGRVLDYIGYWDSGLRIVDVTDPTHPVEVGAFDYGPGTEFRNAHGAVVTPSANWVYVGDEIGSGETGGIHVFDASACDGTSHCTPIHVGFWHIPGHPVQDPAFRGGLLFAFDVHNMDPRGENTLLAGNYHLGVRLLDTTDKTAPEEISFYLPNDHTGDANAPEFFIGRRTWVALFGSDGLVYASDISHGFFILELNPHTVLPAGSSAFARTSEPDDRVGSVRVSSGTERHVITFTTSRAGRVSLSIFDVAGRRVADVTGGSGAAGRHTLEWSGSSEAGTRVASGLYLGRLSTPDGVRTVKLVHLRQ
jgi:hypothetical protein